jgi:hypothetical protein
MHTYPLFTVHFSDMWLSCYIVRIFVLESLYFLLKLVYKYETGMFQKYVIASEK